MVRTSDGVLDINPLERMDKLRDIEDEKRTTISSKRKELEELEKNKAKEIEELEIKKRRELEELENKKKKDFDEIAKKKKELEELEKKKTQEIDDTEELIEKSFQDLMRHKRILLKEEQDIDEKKFKESMSLDYVAKNAPAPKEVMPNQSNYSKFFENLQAPRTVYEATNYNFYNNLTGLRDRAARGEITPQEEQFIAQIRKQFEQFAGDTDAQRKDEHQYIQRSLNVVDQIWQYKNQKYNGY